MQKTAVLIRVLYGEVDRMGVVHHMNYFRYFEHARTEFLRRRGMTYASVEDNGYILPIVDASIRYHAPAKYDDLLEVTAILAEMKKVSVTFDYEVRRADGQMVGTNIPRDVLVRGRTRLAVVDKNGQIARIPPEVIEIVQRPEDPVLSRVP